MTEHQEQPVETKSGTPRDPEQKQNSTGIVWEEEFLLGLGMWFGRDWPAAMRLLERGSAAGRFEYPALRRILAEVTSCLGNSGMRRLRSSLVQSFGQQPEWEPEFEKLLSEAQEPGAPPLDKQTGSKLLSERSLLLFRTGLALSHGFTQAAADFFQKGRFSPTERDDCLSLLRREFGSLAARELQNHLA